MATIITTALDFVIQWPKTFFNDFFFTFFSPNNFRTNSNPVFLHFVSHSPHVFLCSTEAFSPERGAREGATKVMIVVTDGESHDGEELPAALEQCEERNITRYAIAVSTVSSTLCIVLVKKNIFCQN